MTRFLPSSPDRCELVSAAGESWTGPRDDRPRSVLPGGEELHVGPADVDDQDVHRAQPAFPRSVLLETMTSMSSCQDLTKAFAPSSWSWLASASTSTPAFANCASTSSQSPPSAGRIAPSSPWSARALSVPSGMVFTVSGAASALT